MNNYTWNASIEFTHTSNFDKNVTIYKQIDNHKPEANNRWSQPYDSTKKTCILKVNLDEKAVLFNQKVLSHKFGVSILEFNSNGKYIATRTESLPNILFIWDLTTLKYQLIAHDENTIVKNIKWNPTRPDLLLFLVDSCDDYLFFWNGEHGASAVEVPGGFKITSSEWSADGGAVLVGDSTKFCIAVVLDDC